MKVHNRAFIGITRLHCLHYFFMTFTFFLNEGLQQTVSLLIDLFLHNKQINVSFIPDSIYVLLAFLLICNSE